MDSLIHDIRFALRSLRRRPIFACVAIATIALSIGAATAIYSVVDGVLFRSLPFRDPGRLVAIWQTDEKRKTQALLAANWDRMTLDYTDFLTWRERQRSFTAIGVWSGNSVMLQGPSGPERLDAKYVSPGFLSVLGVQPAVGREFLSGEDVTGGPRVTLVGYDTWMSRFGGRRDIVGSTVVFDDGPYQIVGVLPRKFTVERGTPPAAFVLPTGQQTGDVGDHNRSFHAIGRLAPGVSAEQATVETRQLLDANYPATPHGVRIAEVVRDQTRTVRAPLLILLGAAGLLVLIACVNVATLLLGEAASRELEMGARIALGASRRRLIRQLLTESVLLSFVGAALGVALAVWGTKALVALAPPGLPGIDAVHIDLRVLGVALGAALATGALFGLAPARHVFARSRPAPVRGRLEHLSDIFVSVRRRQTRRDIAVERASPDSCARRCAASHEHARARSMLKFATTRPAFGSMWSSRSIHGDSAHTSRSTSASSVARTVLISLKSRSRRAIAAPGQTWDAAIARSRLMCAFMPRSKCCMMTARRLLPAANATRHASVGVPPLRCASNASRYRFAKTTSSRSIRGPSSNRPSAMPVLTATVTVR